MIEAGTWLWNIIEMEAMYISADFNIINEFNESKNSAMDWKV